MELLLDTKEVIDLGKNLQGLNIDCTFGQCWVTQAGDNRDHILEAGSSFQAKISGHLIVTATSSCRLKLSQSQGKAFSLLKKIHFPGFSALRLT